MAFFADDEPEKEELREQIDKLSDEVIDLRFKQKNSNEVYLAELVREIYHSIETYDPERPDLEDLSVEDILRNLKNRLREFSRDTGFNLR